MSFVYVCCLRAVGCVCVTFSCCERELSYNFSTKQKCVEAGISGLLVTCDSHEKQAIAEAYNIIDHLMEDSQGSLCICFELSFTFTFFGLFWMRM